MRLEVLLSVMNYKLKDLDKHNITSDCIVINQCDKDDYKKHKNFKIYSYKERGHANSCNRALEHATADILIFCDDDVKYNTYYDKKIIKAFEDNPKADMIIFNVINKYRKKRFNERVKRLHFYNILNYASYNIAFKRDSIKDLKMNPLFGAGATYSSGGDDTLFLIGALKRGLKVYTTPVTIGNITTDDSTWFKGYNNKYFNDKGSLYTAICKPFRHLLFLQHLIRHRELLTDLSFTQAYKEMVKGSKEYLKRFKS